MGRYYSGDIEGKFWFGVQPSDVAESFGAVEQEQYCIDYVIYRKHLDKTHKRMAQLVAEMGDTKQKLDDFLAKTMVIMTKFLKKMALILSTFLCTLIGTLVKISLIFLSRIPMQIIANSLLNFKLNL